jgi:hypothetical protein
MVLTASYIAACIMAKLRVGWTVAGCAPGVRTITRSVLFHWITWLTGLVASAIEGAGFAPVNTATAVAASNSVFNSDLTKVDAVDRRNAAVARTRPATLVIYSARCQASFRGSR